MDSLTDTLTCPVCFEDFEEDGDNVPRLLPCSHSLCHTCVGQMIRNNRLECPTCRMRHEVRRDEINFPQNRYILTLMRRRPRIEVEEKAKTRKCPEHDKEEILFCREAGCQKKICTLCLSESHLRHTVVAIEEETKDALTKMLKNIEILNFGLNKKITEVTKASQTAIEKTMSSLDELKRTKQESKNLRGRNKK